VEQSRRKPTRARQCLTDYESTEAEPLARHAVELDPGHAQAYAILAESQFLKFFLDSRQEILNEALVYAKKATSLPSPLTNAPTTSPTPDMLQPKRVAL
jgi:hypothetical protein